jgi:hypothetical protein
MPTQRRAGSIAEARRYSTPKEPSAIAAMIAMAKSILEMLDSLLISVASFMKMPNVKFKLYSP